MSYESSAVGDRVTTPMPPNDGAMISVFTSAVQQQLLRNGRDLGPTGADGDWGDKTNAAFAAAEASIPFTNSFGRSFAYRVSTDKSSVNMTGDLWNAIQRLPTIARVRPPSPHPPDGGDGPANNPPILPGGGSSPSLLPWIIGGVVLAGIGAYFYFTPKKKVSANRQRRLMANSHRGPKIGRIEDDTPIRLLAVADGVIAEAAAEVRGGAAVTGRGSLTGSVRSDQNTAARLADEAERVYKHNAEFRKKVRGRGNSGRDYLWSVMKHWLASELKKKHPSVFKKLPHGWGWNR